MAGGYKGRNRWRLLVLIRLGRIRILGGALAEPAHISDLVVREEEFVRAGVYSLIGTLVSASPD